MCEHEERGESRSANAYRGGGHLRKKGRLLRQRVQQQCTQRKRQYPMRVLARCDAALYIHTYIHTYIHIFLGGAFTFTRQTKEGRNERSMSTSHHLSLSLSYTHTPSPHVAHTVTTKLTHMRSTYALFIPHTHTLLTHRIATTGDSSKHHAAQTPFFPPTISCTSFLSLSFVFHARFFSPHHHHHTYVYICSTVQYT